MHPCNRRLHAKGTSTVVSKCTFTSCQWSAIALKMNKILSLDFRKKNFQKSSKVLDSRAQYIFWKMRSTLVARVRFSVLQSSLLHIYCCTVSICTVNERKRIAVVHNRACVCSNKLHWTLVLFPPLSPFSSSKTQRFWLLVIFFSLLYSPPAWLCGSD